MSATIKSGEFSTLFTTTGGAHYRICAITDSSNPMACTIRIEPEDDYRIMPSPASPVQDDRPLLTQREIEVAALVTEGCTNAQIASTLCISLSTVKTHIQSIYSKLNITNRAMLAKYMLEFAA